MFLKVVMNHRFISLLCIVLFGQLATWAQNTYIVQQFGKELSYWASSKNTYSALESMEKLCSQNPSILIGDKIMEALASSYGVPQSDTYRWDSYINCMEKEITKGIDVSVSRIETVPSNLIPEKYKNDKSLSFVSCNIKMTGASNFDENDLFVLRNNKIVKIQNYQVVTDKKGRRRLHVDLSDLGIDEDTEGWGISYNYSKAFPLGASITYSKWKFMVSVDFGVNFDKDLYTTQKVDFKNIVDYSITRGEYDLKYFLTATPAFYLKYFSVGWGFGMASLKGNEYTKQTSLTIHEDGTVIQTTGSTSSTSGDEKLKFMMRPTVKGYIPCNDNFFISLSVSYDWILGYKDKSGIGFGAGIHFLLD